MTRWAWIMKLWEGLARSRTKNIPFSSSESRYSAHVNKNTPKKGEKIQRAEYKWIILQSR